MSPRPKASRWPRSENSKAIRATTEKSFPPTRYHSASGSSIPKRFVPCTASRKEGRLLCSRTCLHPSMPQCSRTNWRTKFSIERFGRVEFTSAPESLVSLLKATGEFVLTDGFEREKLLAILCSAATNGELESSQFGHAELRHVRDSDAGFRLFCRNLKILVLKLCTYPDVFRALSNGVAHGLIRCAGKLKFANVRLLALDND